MIILLYFKIRSSHIFTITICVHIKCHHLWILYFDDLYRIESNQVFIFPIRCFNIVFTKRDNCISTRLSITWLPVFGLTERQAAKIAI